MTTPSYTEIETFLYSASIGYEAGIHVFLKKYGSAFIDAKDSLGWTALMHAAGYQHNEKILALLLKAGANLFEVSIYGSTARSVALQTGRNSNATFLSKWPELEKQEQERARQQAEEQRLQNAQRCQDRIQKLKQRHVPFTPPKRKPS